jgi:two-component system cell cycle sensor histidine kinase/response regulator CckA
MEFEKTIIDGMSEGLCVCHATEEYPLVKFTVWNNHMQKITGYTMDEINRLGWYQTMYPDKDYQKRAINRMERMRNGDNLCNEEWTIACADGSRRIIAISTKMVISKDESAHVLGIMRDVTEQKQAEDSIREITERLTMATQSAQLGVWDWDIKNNILAWDDQMFEIYGIARDSFINAYEAWESALHPEDRTSAVEAAKAAIRGEKNYATEFRIICPDDSIKFITAFGQVTRDKDGNAVRMIGINRDISDRKNAEESLNEHQQFTENLIANSSVATFVIDKNHKIMLWNKACEALTGYAASAMVGTDRQWTPFYSYKRPTVADIIIDEKAEDIPKLYQIYSKAVLNPKGIKAEGWYDELGGKNRYIVFEAAPVYNSKREMVAAIETLQDFTESKKLADQLVQSQKMEAIGQLAGGVAHDFNNMLTAIIGYAHATLMKLPEDSLLRRNMEQILGAADRAAALTQSLLSFSRKQVIAPKAVNLNDIIKKLDKILLKLIREDIKIKKFLATEELTVFVDSIQIEQVVMNLVTNSRDAMPASGSISIRTGSVQINEEFVHAHGYGTAGKYALLSISDTGEGMDEKTREKIFEPFFTTKELGKGTGIGLATVYGIAKQNNGFINVYSEVGKGTTFKIYLPLFSSVKEEELKDSDEITVPGGTETILIAEDDDSLRGLAAMIIADHGYTVITAVDGEDAVAKYIENKDNIQLIILDAIMPQKNGKEAWMEIQRINSSVKVIFVSGYTEDVISKGGILEPNINFLSKPLTPQELLKKIREVLDN